MWVPVSIWVISLLNWWIAGDVDAVTGIGGIGVAIMLGVMTFKPPAPGLAPVMFGTVVVTVLFYPVVRAAMAHRELKAIDIEGVEAGYAILGQRPRDPLGRLKIAKHIYKLGYPGHAIAIMDSILPQSTLAIFKTSTAWFGIGSFSRTCLLPTRHYLALSVGLQTLQEMCTVVNAVNLSSSRG